MRSRIDAAIERALDARQREAAEEVDRILSAALGVIERTGPAPPKVSDIVAAAGTSNAAFYRYFTGKDELLLAVMERGVNITAAYLKREMAAQDDPVAKVRTWIIGALGQVGEPRRTARSRAVLSQFSSVPDGQITAPMRDLLVPPLTDLGSADPARDADALFTTVSGVLRRHAAAETQPGRDEIEHVVSFCLAAVDTDREHR
ncbi:helix-turn-helix domain-containing protein [[Mycobacterium] wendilense]|uniref:Helix-turn-helix domain-containing protein n=1 Tax=[Mycobacterium] wendilense TaxID=3064284 RepID=A0ABN9P6J1_9MYCO|nr:helix-turn-helix domain-containing protein [Mycolicibacterium sp. MU0050]CAJ1586700.1 helix-turn-helix domain-containing protein [Mycolicibacterium sp. MU0050]